VTLLVVLGIVGAPAVALRAFCVGPSCDEEPAAERVVPFCSLSGPVRDLLAAGFREGRSPDAMGVAAADTLLRSDSDDRAPWPSATEGAEPATVPIAFVGNGVRGGPIPPARLDDVAPTIEPLLGFRRPFPGVRSGEALPGVIDPEARSSLVVTIVWKRAGADARASFGRALDGPYRATIGEAAVGSLPLDPAAVLTTIGTGGLPADHGITGSIVRADDGAPAPAWSGRAPTSVIATLGDDLDAASEGDARIGIVAHDRTDRGLIGGTWYVTNGHEDDDDVVIERRDAGRAAEELIVAEGYGGGGSSADLLGVTLDGSGRRAIHVTRALVTFVLATVPDSTVVLTATGDARPEGVTLSADAFVDDVETAIGAPAVGAVAAGGVFVDQDVVTERNISTQRIVDAMMSIRAPSGDRVMADAFPSFAVAFGRYC